MDSEKKDWPQEQQRVDMVVNEINKRTLSLKGSTGNVRSEIIDLRKNFWNEITVNFDEPDDIVETAASIKQQAELLSERERSHGQLDSYLKTLARLRNNPYFGRIDFKEEGETEAEPIYLGIASFMDENDENFLIYDWRAPVSSMYYDYPPGPAKYETPEGTIHGEMELKRQFIIRDSKINGLFDTGITIGDELLQEVLGNNASTQMKSIVATIQKEQNQIIRNERSKLLVVQGVAGSGKTSAALQRVAYLLYRYRGTLKSENIMLFSPNPLFNSYVSTVLPELGEENMVQATYQEYLDHRLSKEFKVENLFEQMEYLLSGMNDQGYETRLGGIRYKSSLHFKEAIDRYVDYLTNEGLIFKTITFRGKTLISATEVSRQFYSFDPSFSIPNRIALLAESLLKQLRRLARQERSEEWVEAEIELLDKEDYMEAYKHLQKKGRSNEESFEDYEMEKEFLAKMIVNKRFKPLFSRVKRLAFIDMKAIYHQFFNESFSVDMGIFPQNWREICSLTSTALKRNELLYEDATPFLYLQDRIEGRKSNTAIRHVFIDEAQDYSPFQYAYIKELFPYSSITILGDINQAIYSNATNSPTLLSEALHDDQSESILLTRSYRSTKQIVEFTSRLIEGGETIQPFNREGSKPALTKVNQKRELHIDIIRRIHELQASGYRTIAVICKTAKESREAFNAVKEELDVRLIETGTISYEQGISIIPACLAKGIEFDAVILYNVSADTYGRESERKLFYTVCTRAMHELNMYYIGEKSPFIGGLPLDTYTQIEQ